MVSAVFHSPLDAAQQLAEEKRAAAKATVAAPSAALAAPYDSAEAVWNEHRESTRGRDLDVTGLSYALLDRAGPQQWPFPSGASRGAVRLYADGVFATPDGRARFAPAAQRATVEKRDAHYPFSLNT
jgi:assimilatory nitrate reductase catalytic subunit